mgnify:FL=1
MGNARSCLVETESTVQSLVPGVCEASECEVAGIYLGDASRPAAALQLVAHCGLSLQEAEGCSTLEPGEGLAGHALISMAPLALAKGDRLPRGARPSAVERGFASFACAPFQVEAGPVGVVWALTRERTLDPEQLLPVVNLAAQAVRHVVASQRAVETFALERDRYQQLAANVGDCLWTMYIEPRIRIALMSDGVEELTGYSRDRFVGDPGLWQEIVHADDRWALSRMLARVREGVTNEVHYRIRIVRQDGELRWAHTRGRAVRDETGLRIDAITSDVTAHVRLEEKVRRADRLSAVGMLAGGIAHEYNNLHFAILGTLDLLLMRDDLDDAIRQHVNRVRDAAQRASEITNNLVAFARGGSGVRAVLNLSELVESTLNVVRKEFTTSGIEVEMSHSDAPTQVMGNRAELGQVLINLIVNSRQALDDAPEKRLVVTTGTRDNRAFARIADTGHGISPENLPRLFDPFFTTKGAAGSWLEDRTQSDAYLPGRGLGLSVAQTIVSEHGGEIEVESAPGEGAVFTVYLPVYEPEGGVIATDPMATNLRKGRILVADDEPSVRAVCRELLSRLSYDVTEAAGGQEAVELLTRERYALVLVDLQMPDMDGLDLIRRINEMPERRRPAKLVITGMADHIAPETCEELGIASTVMKPASLVELTEKVRLALSRGG